MKRWITGLLAAVLLLAGCTAAAEGGYGMTDAEIQESMETREGETLGTLSENLGLVRELFRDEEFVSLFRIEDVKEITNEVIVKVAEWMLENRPVTMKILKEFGVDDEDIDCVGKLWDSADRISEAQRAFNETDEGRKLQADIEALKTDPEIAESLENFMTMITSDELHSLISTIFDTLRSGGREQPATDQAAENTQADGPAAGLNGTTFTGGLVIALLDNLAKSEWARDSVPALAENKNLQNVLNDLAESTVLDEALRKELMTIADDPDITAFLERTVENVLLLLNEWTEFATDEAPEEENETISEEAAP